MKISLVHATWKSKVPPSKIMEIWLDRASNPRNVEYCVGLDSDDTFAEENSIGLNRSINPPNAIYSTSVRNWNAAARISSGDLLFAMSDDLEPPDNWDLSLTKAVGALDPLKHRFVVKIQDSPWATDTLCRHPVVSRAWYERFGFFDPRFHGVYCDTDLTLRAYKNSFIIDARDLLKVVHKNPLVDKSFVESESHLRQNSSAAYKQAEAIYNSIWPESSKPMHVSLVKPVRFTPPFRQFKLFRETVVALENFLAHKGVYASFDRALVGVRAWLSRYRLGEWLVSIYRFAAKK